MRALRWGWIALLATPAMAHGGHAHADAPGWTWDPLITVPLALVAVLFATGWWRLRARSGQGRARLDRRASLFAGGWLVLAGALVSPLHEAGERSFAAHMIEHELLMLAAAPLLVLAEPLSMMLWAFPAGARRALGAVAGAAWVARPWRWLTGATVATVLQAAALWVWHAPGPFDAALANEALHAAQHLSFLVTALFFWTAMFGRRTARGVAALCLIATSLVTGALGALMALSTSPWYAGYRRLGLVSPGMTAAEDQQLAGLIMWIPGGMVHAIVALLIVRAMLADPPRSAAHAV